MAVQHQQRSKAAMLPSLQMVSAWAAALQGSGDLGQAADQLMGLMPVRYLRLVRINLQTGDVKRIHASQGAPLRDREDHLWDPSFLPGRVMQGQDGTMRGIVLGRTPHQCDMLQLRLFRPFTVAQNAFLCDLAEALAASWANRQPGLIAARAIDLSRRHASRQVERRTAPILDYSNPYALSRAEFRVCAMIGLGLTAKRIARELRLSEATVRSHQQAIYAKTELGGQMEVMYHLQSHPTAQSLLGGLQGRAA